ncbi:MAG: hypothetical protein NTW46_03410 [Candidatus Nealsonbacteria bacterium]|nr:hypothetical protein [Candidatus Nealsonbacteria bacterium]
MKKEKKYKTSTVLFDRRAQGEKNQRKNGKKIEKMLHKGWELYDSFVSSDIRDAVYIVLHQEIPEPPAEQKCLGENNPPGVLPVG